MIDIEKLDALPKRQGRKERIVEILGSMHNMRDPVDEENDPWKIAGRVAKAYIGKNWDKAFSYYCKQVPVGRRWRYEAFMRLFNGYYRWNSDKWGIDKNNCITFTPYKRNKRIIFYSIDYRTELFHKVTGAKRSDYYWAKKTYKDSDYEYRIVQGWEKEFKTRKDPEYIRLSAEKKQMKARMQREFQKQEEQRYFDMLTRNERKLLEEKEKNSQVIQAHGFDETISFRK